MQYCRERLSDEYLHVSGQFLCFQMTLILIQVLGDRFVSEAADDTQPNDAGCMPGTRTGILTKLVEWAIGDPKRIYWLSGMAGTGKSSIALTLCRMLRDEPVVFFGGGFFCSRSSGSVAQKDVRRILPTLARLVAGNSPEFATALAVELEKTDRVAFKPVREQIGPLLCQPLSALAQYSQPIIFVIDALDELRDDTELAQLLKLIASFRSDVQVKFILTSRPGMHIRNDPISSLAHSVVLNLQEVDLIDVQRDIRRYIDTTLAAFARRFTWYTTSQVDALTELSNGLFIFASTALKYILDPNNDTARSVRLRKAITAVALGTAATSELDKMYELVIGEASDPATIDAEELKELQLIIACILTSRLPLTVQALAELVNVGPDMLRSSLRHLHAVVWVPGKNDAPGLRTIHASFGDYLYDRALDRIRISRSLGHYTLAHACLDVMEKQLHFNISGSTSSYEPNSSTKADNVTASLEYACLHWAHHVAACAPCDPVASDVPFDAKIDRIFCTKFLHWLEVLSVLRKVGLASGLLMKAGCAVSRVTQPWKAYSCFDRSITPTSCDLFVMQIHSWLRLLRQFSAARRIFISRSSHLQT